MASRQSTTKRGGGPGSFIDQPPNPDALVESLRAFGYSLNDAVADLIDNSVAAKAKNVWLEFDWNGGADDMRVVIRDDGRGMAESTLLEAMRLGSRRPSDNRERSDLGRYSLGLKTASFSQAQGLAVLSKTKAGKVAGAYWDLDVIREARAWKLGSGIASEAEETAKALEKNQHGTCVIWYKIDRLGGGVGEEGFTREKFNDLILHVGNHVRGAFHKFMEDGLKIHLNGTALKPWDPFLLSNKFTYPVLEETWRYKGEKIQVRGYVLPFEKNRSSDDDREAEHTKGWIEHQGFHVHRAGRLIVDGTWFGYDKKHPTTNLARLDLEIPNSLDKEFHVDVRKATLIPPLALKEKLKRAADLCRTKAKEVYTKRGQMERRTQGDTALVWRRRMEQHSIVYRINREHTVVKDMLADKALGKSMSTLIALIEKSVPLPDIRVQMQENPDKVQWTESPEVSETLAELAEQYVRRRVAAGRTLAEAIQWVKGLEAFCNDALVIKRLEALNHAR